MRIKATRELAREDGHLVFAGQEIVVGDAEAKKLLSEGLAVPVGEPPVARAEKRAKKKAG